LVVPIAMPRSASISSMISLTSSTCCALISLRQRDRGDGRADDGFEVAHRHAHRPIDAYNDIGAAARHQRGRLHNERAGMFFLRRGDRILEVEDDRVGPALRGALDKAPLRYRHEQHRAPHRQVGFQFVSPFSSSALA